jgi:nucleotide-binding universal stress UspA family protein
MSEKNAPITVGIDNSGAPAAVAFAVREARERACPVHLVHVLNLPPGEAYVGAYVGVLEDANKGLADALVHARDLAGEGIQVTGEVIDQGYAVPMLVDRLRSSRLGVLQHHRAGVLHRLVAGSVASGVAARAAAPVVSVPDGWDSQITSAAPVTVAVQDVEEPVALLRTALIEAEARGALLVVLHAWWLASGYDVVLDAGVQRQEELRIRAALEPLVESLHVDFPSVPTRVDVRHAPPVEAILDASNDSSLVVIGRRHHLLPLGTHLGPVARATLARAECPVLVAPETRRTTDAGVLVAAFARPGS